jgi:hypothetical protein
VEDLGTNGRITAEWISKRWDGEDRNRWLALVGVVMNMQISPNEGNFLTSCKTS